MFVAFELRCFISFTTATSDSSEPARKYVEPWLSSCRAVEAPSSRCRGRCRGLACRALSSLSSSCRAPSRLTTCGGASSCCRGLSRAVEFLCRGCRKAVELCRVCCRAREWHVALLFCMKHSDSHSSRPRGPTHKPPTKLQGLQTDKELGDRTSQPIDTT